MRPSIPDPNSATERYLPALSYRWLTRFYDPVVHWTTRESTFKVALLDQVDLQPGERLLDLACGTATLTIAARRRWPEGDIRGIDGDPEVLAKGRAKAAAAGINLELDQALSTAIPHNDQSFDAVMSSLFFHHLTREAKLKTLAEVSRILKPGGWLHIADWGRAGNPLMRAAFLLVQLLDGFETTRDNVQGLLPSFLDQAGFTDVSERRRFATPLGVMSLYSARKRV